MKLRKYEKSKQNIRILYLDYYYGLNSSDNFSNLINKLRNFEESSIDHFVKIFSRIKTDSSFIMCVVPSKKIKKKNLVLEKCV